MDNRNERARQSIAFWHRTTSNDKFCEKNRNNTNEHAAAKQWQISIHRGGVLLGNRESS